MDREQEEQEEEVVVSHLGRRGCLLACSEGDVGVFMVREGANLRTLNVRTGGASERERETERVGRG